MPLDGQLDNDPFRKANENSPIMFPVGSRAVGWQTRDGGYNPILTHKAIIRTKDEGKSVRVLNVVGANYKLVHNKELFTHIEDTLRKKMHADALRGVLIKDSVAGWGRTCYREYVFPNIQCTLTRGAKSPIAFRLIVQNGYGGSALRVHAGAIEFFCTNGMVRGAHDATYHKHTSGLVVAGIGDTLDRALNTFADSKLMWQRWADTPVKHQAAMELFAQLASSDKLSNRLGDQYLREVSARGHNLYAVYSALTYYASHADGEFTMRSTVEEQDTVASTMLARELTVAKWVKSDAWQKLETV